MEQADAVDTLSDKRNLRMSIVGALTSASARLRKPKRERALIAIGRLQTSMPHALHFIGPQETAYLEEFFRIAPPANPEIRPNVAKEREISALLRDEELNVSPECRACFDRILRDVMGFSETDLGKTKREALVALRNFVSHVRKQRDKTQQ